MGRAFISLLLLVLLVPGLAWSQDAPPLRPAPEPEIELTPPDQPAMRPKNPKEEVDKWLLAHLAIPGSYEAIDWSEPVFNPGGYDFVWSIRMLYAYEHPEYGPMIADDIFYFDPEGVLAGRTNVSIWRNQRTLAPDWGRGWEKWGPMGLQQIDDEINRYQDAQDGDW